MLWKEEAFYNELLSEYENYYFSIVHETFPKDLITYDPPSLKSEFSKWYKLQMGEKTLLPMTSKTIFFSNSLPNIEKKLNEIGIETFSYLFEEYDALTFDNRSDVLISICKKINKSPKNQPILFVLHEFFLFYKSDLKEHFNEEETLVFPLANHLHNLEQNPNDQKSIFWMSQHLERALSFIKSHKKEDSDLREINSAFLSYKNSIPETAAAHEVLLKEFHEFQKDMKIHERIEDFVFSKKGHQLLKNFNTRIN